ncbi:flagellum-specific ATP synthase FliI, partial [Porticoccaceae bacterium]|nr:flagellum-specific ATP synthase FliI [Porticoccaceae bacterium]
MLDFSAAIDSQIAELMVPEPILSGKLVRVVGLTLEAKGIIAPLGAHCRVENVDMGTQVDAEVVGFNDDTLYLMPFSEPVGIGPGA